jgi:dihydrofolate synthase/folylpolyglutamate synthase
MLSQLPMYQKKGAQAYKPDLSRMRDFCQYLDQPQDKIKTIHVAGTNGKGSTAHLMASVLQQHDYRVGLYTSPHLKDFRERIKINGELIDKNFIVEFVQNHRDYFELHALSFFEMTVGLAFSYFAKKKVDIAVIEVGMGGRLDGTNLIQPELSVITNIGFDHMQFLGYTLPAIAKEKAGIIKPETPVIIGLTQAETEAVFFEKARKMASEITFADQIDPIGLGAGLKGRYQLQNIQTAVVGLRYLKGFDINDKKLKEGLMNVVSNTGIQGRWQVLNDNPKIVADVAHNKEGLDYVIPQIKAENYDQLHLVLGFVNDKAVEQLLRLFPADALFYFAAPDIPRAFPVIALEKIAKKMNLNFKTFSSVSEALSNAQSIAGTEDFIYVGGSTFVVADVI